MDRNNREIIDKALTALRDLCALVPEADREKAEWATKVLEHVLNAYSHSLDSVRQIDAAIYHENAYRQHKLGEIDMEDLLKEVSS